MQITYSNTPHKVAPLHEKVFIQKSFDSFINKFKSTLATVFHTENDIDQLSVQRGLPVDVLERIMSSNPLSLCIPKEYGGRGGNVQENLTLLSAASYESLALSLTIGINSALFLQPVAKYGQEPVKAFVFNRFIQEQNMGGLMITEPGHGSDALNMQTSYVEEKDNYHIRGIKHWAGLTGQADFWVLTARKQTMNGGLQRDVDLFVCDNSAARQKIIVDEYFENLGLYQILYGRNILDVQIPKIQRLEPKTTGVQMLLDLLHRSRMQFPGIGQGFIKRMLDEALVHCQNRFVGGKTLFHYDQVQQQLARLQANFTICSALCTKSSELADIKNDLNPFSLEANIIKTVSSDLMQQSAQTLMQLVGAIGYKLNHIAGRAIVDSRPFQIFEGANDILYTQISESLIKLMKAVKEMNVWEFLKDHPLTSRAVEFVKELLNFNIDLQMPQRKLVELGRALSRIVSMDLVIQMGHNGFRSDLIEGAVSCLYQEISHLMNAFSFKQNTMIVENYEEGSSWANLATT
ncbi:MAG: acyl-CoA dehydrogenase family protein [Bacteroidota bacterium]|nr:acyl-CoA dehydrogenase family protein [Bacteroidota bacterium]